MSKRRQRMESFGEAARRKSNLKPAPEPWTVKDRVLVVGAFAAALLFYLGTPVLRSVMAQRKIVSARLAYWKTQYQLSDAEVERLREIEFRVHGSGLQFASKTRSHQQNQAHKQELSEAMSPKAAQEFLKNYEKKNPCGR